MSESKQIIETGLELPVIIFECANAHGGSFDTLKATIEKFGAIDYKEKHIKFQAFHPDTIALPDFSGYPIYKDLLLQHEQWAELINDAVKNFNGVWLDIFDRYGVEVFEKNAQNIVGIKLQASVLDNRDIIDGLKKNNILQNKLLMINISGYEVDAVSTFISVFSQLGMRELILQIGHQAYPTQLKDTGIQKIQLLHEYFPNYQICIADHAEAGTDFSCIVPLLGLAAGASLIEKHICLDRKNSKYDFYSAIEPEEMELLINRIKSSAEILNGPFVSESENEYLKKSIQVPIAENELPQGSLISEKDIIFRRTAQSGFTFSAIQDLQQKSYILKDTIAPNSTIGEHHFKVAKIGVIVACRMKSSRLKAKAFELIDGLSSIERCLQNCLDMKQAEVVVLATSTVEEDAVLEEKTLGGKVEFWKGDPDDVIQRYIGACDKYGIDIVIRVTGDCPVISSDIMSYLLDHHLRVGADYTAARKSAVGTACEIYNVEVLRRILKFVGKAQHSEYMTWYLQNNQDLFKVEIIDLPANLVRDYRLTLDYPEDLQLFNELFKALRLQSLEPTIENIFNILDNNLSISQLNSHLTLMYKTDQALIDKLNKETKINLLS
ncbi:N-acetylneuraminate synthase family protein [Sediminibacterium sp.]|uniref:cytidylyltransferase domain-containing protein n=1 Tax=Sediminibacterium sp. TaxID=1917865 RepID=UPI0025E86123|nr:N-acetylneuraminate synthase family protein [Sediminibacterium sp.]MBT9485442.1 N-acetylneuraminate synthase family protein [Sediminibacterium sp.]